MRCPPETQTETCLLRVCPPRGDVGTLRGASADSELCEFFAIAGVDVDVVAVWDGSLKPPVLQGVEELAAVQKGEREEVEKVEGEREHFQVSMVETHIVRVEAELSYEGRT